MSGSLENGLKGCQGMRKKADDDEERCTHFVTVVRCRSASCCLTSYLSPHSSVPLPLLPSSLCCVTEFAAASNGRRQSTAAHADKSKSSVGA